ncbi:reverse transcriptase domain-containing protein [Tanacetum coccineum]
MTPTNHAEGTTKREGLEGAGSSAMQDEEAPWTSIFCQPSKSSNLPFPSRVKKQKKDDDDERLLSIFKQIHINLPFLEAMIHMPKGAKVNKFIFPVDFVVLEMDEDELVSIILRRPFLATAQAVIDVHEGKLNLRVRNETVTFNIRKSMKSKYSRDDYLYCADHTT